MLGDGVDLARHGASHITARRADRDTTLLRRTASTQGLVSRDGPTGEKTVVTEGGDVLLCPNCNEEITYERRVVGALQMPRRLDRTSTIVVYLTCPNCQTVSPHQVTRVPESR